MVTVPNILVVHPSVPAKTLQELIAYAKANPGKLTYASQGIGASGHIAGELFKLAAGVDITHVPYRGAAPAAQDLAAGHVSMMFDVVSLALGPIKAGTVRALGVGVEAARRGAARRADDGRRRPSARGRRLVRAAGAGRNAAAGDRLAQPREPARRFGAPDARDSFVAQGATHAARHAGGVSRLHRGTDGALWRRDPARRDQSE